MQDSQVIIKIDWFSILKISAHNKISHVMWSPINIYMLYMGQTTHCTFNKSMALLICCEWVNNPFILSFSIKDRKLDDPIKWLSNIHLLFKLLSIMQCVYHEEFVYYTSSFSNFPLMTKIKLWPRDESLKLLIKFDQATPHWEPHYVIGMHIDKTAQVR